jgi:signal peptidase
MEPGLPPGTLIVVKPQPVETIKPGDVVTYQIAPGEPDVITHRVIAISSTSAGDREFITQGDNNGAEDDPVIEDQIMGVLWYSVPYLGFASTSLNGEARTWIIPAVATALFVYAGFSIAAGVVAARRRAQARRNASRAEGALDHGPNERRASSTGA